MRIKQLDGYEFFAAFLLVNLLSLLVSPAPHASFDESPLRSFSQGLDSLYAQAAGHAASHGVPVQLCPVRWIYFDCDDRGDWSHGLMGFADGNYSRQLNIGEEVLRRHLPLPSHLRLRALGRARSIRFAPGNGRVDHDVPLLLCDLDGSPRGWVLRYRDGRGFASRDADAAELSQCRADE